MQNKIKILSLVLIGMMLASGIQAATTIGSNIATGGNITVNTDKFVVTGSNGNLAINTNKFTVDGATGNTLVAGTLTVTGAQTFTGALYADGGVDKSTATALALGAINANAVNISRTGMPTTILGTFNVDQATTLDTTLGVTGLLTANGGITADAGVFTVADATGALHTAGDFDVATSKFTVASATGNTVVQGTLTTGNISAYGAGANQALTIDAKGTETITVGGTSTGNVIIGPTGKTLTLVNATGAVTVAAGGLTVTAGGMNVTGASTITGALGGLTGLTVASGGANITGNSTITGALGGLTGLTVASGGAAITGNSAIVGALTGLTGLTVASGTVSLPNDQIGVAEIAQGTAGQLLMSDATPDTNWVSMSGDVTIDGAGVTTIGANKVALTTDTTGDYVASLTAGNGIAVGAAAEAGTPSVALAALTADWDQTGAFDVVLNNASSELKIRGSGGAFYGIFDVGAAVADRTYTFPDATGEVSLLGQTIETGEITDGTIANADISAAAVIALSKLASGASAQIIVGNATGVPTYVDMTGDVTITNAGVSAIGALKVTNAMIAAAAGIPYSKLTIADADLTIAKTTGLQAALDLKSPLASPTFTGT
ncbi:MAG: hypothetical protein Q8N16_00005, partial [bacterium]|nr:hypothetical protein [bacterium]